MGWFDEQIRQRKENDDQVFEESFIRVAAAVLGSKAASRLDDDLTVTRAAIEEILKFYHYKPTEVPDTITDADEQLEFLLRPHGLMRRNVTLEKGWYRDAYGPLLATKKDGTVVALLPSGLIGYHYLDRSTGSYVRLNSKTEEDFLPDAICFYRPLPLRKIGIPDLILYLKDSLQVQDLSLIVAITLVVTLVGMIMPRLTKLLTGVVLESGSVNLLSAITVLLVCTAVSSTLFNAMRTLLLGRIATKTNMSVQSAMMMRILTLPADFFRQYGAGELAQRSQSVNALCDLLISSLMSTGLTSITSLLYITQIFHFARPLVLPSLLIIFATVGLSLISSLLQMKIAKQQMELGAKESGMSYALITGIQKIRLSGAEKRAFARWANLYAKGAELSYNPPTFLKLNSVFSLAISLIGTLILYYLAIVNQISQADFMAFNAAYGTVMGAFASFAGIALSIARIKPILEMAEPFLKAEPEVQDGKEVLTRVSGSIEMNNVYFRYNEAMPYVIEDFSLKIHAGEYVAIVGSTGCGKSTLMRLLLGFEKPEKGAIYYDGKDMSRIDLRSLRRCVGAVMQNGNLLQGDIFSNITISAPQLTLKDAWEAAEIAGIADDIRSMPMGMQTIISEGQGGISGGQKQRIMIARAIAPKPKILMFDEATSALDNKTQKQLSEALDSLRCTRIVIAHRLSTIRHCDRIIVLEKGHIIEDGTYDELIAKRGFFAELVSRQQLNANQ